MSNGPFVNTDRELWRQVPGDYYSPRIFVTEGGGIGIDVGGSVYVKPIREWHRLAGGPLRGISKPAVVPAPPTDNFVFSQQPRRSWWRTLLAWLANDRGDE